MRTLRNILWLAAALSLSATSAAADPHGIVPVPRDRHGGGIDVEVWTNRGTDGVFQPGDEVGIRFRTNDDAFVCLYNIDVEGRVRILFPAHPEDDGFVRGGRLVRLPSRRSGVDFVVSGPAGVEYIVAVASAYPLRNPWTGADDGGYHGESYADDVYEDGYAYDDDHYYEDGYDDYEEHHWYGASSRSPHGMRIQGDPFVAMRRLHHWLVPGHASGYVDTDYATLFVERRFRYPRYVCSDCHAYTAGVHPYRDRCSVFSVQVNVGWRYRPWVRVGHARSRYVYVRHPHVPRPYRAIKRSWPAHERRVLVERFRARRWKAPGRQRVNPAKPEHGYRWKESDPYRRDRPRLSPRPRGRAGAKDAVREPRRRGSPAPSVQERSGRSKERGQPSKTPPPAKKKKSQGKQKSKQGYRSKG